MDTSRNKTGRTNGKRSISREEETPIQREEDVAANQEEGVDQGRVRNEDRAEYS